MTSAELVCSRLPVRSPDGDYEIVLGRGILDNIGELARQVSLGRRVVIVTDPNVAPLYADSVVSSLRKRGFETSIAIMPGGEQHKTWDSVSLLVDHFLAAGLDRSGWVLALGGGVVGDTAGFAASIYMRGVPLLQVPTTLLAMADSSVGGKVGVDHAAGKNLLGAFKQPRLVVVDLETLQSLPPDQAACGMAEIIKAAIIGDPALFDLIEHSHPDTLDYERVLHRAIDVKRGIVERDPYESGERALLNLGHTFGHAFERCTGYARFHGYAVAQGIAVAFRLAEALRMCDTQTSLRMEVVLRKWGLPVRWGVPGLVRPEAVAEVLEAMMSDKKRLDGRFRLVLPEEIGRVHLIDDVPESEIKRALVELQ
jgi:3-dehydroquinate synthase